MTAGIINVNKPADWTSHDCVAVMRKVLGIKKVGHTGTLDPMATGVLPVCVGSATRIMEYLDLDFKTYECEMELGLESDTLDIWGEVTSRAEAVCVNEEQVRQAFASFSGRVSQIPPKFSALKVDGKKLYQYARAGEEVEIKPRDIFIQELKILKMDLENRKIIWQVTCSKGTYIRSICRDVGRLLGCGAVMSGLRRLSSGVFSIEQAVDIRDIREMDREEVEKLLLAIDYPLVHFGKAVLNKKQAQFFCNGGHIVPQETVVEKKPIFESQEPHISVRPQLRRAYNMYLRDGREERFLGVAFYNAKYKTFAADKVFYRG